MGFKLWVEFKINNFPDLGVMYLKLHWHIHQIKTVRIEPLMGRSSGTSQLRVTPWGVTCLFWIVRTVQKRQRVRKLVWVIRTQCPSLFSRPIAALHIPQEI